ncbi:MAG: hypothetical protein FWC33_07300 [Candidatus Bathyarchaeota archaeon]|nr:hypothetical protein [Candidatus Termiticorpusculum sp.]
MSSDKEKLYQLSARVDELLVTINKTTEELRSISASIKLLAVGQTQQQTQTNTNNTQKPTTLNTVYTQQPTTTATIQPSSSYTVNSTPTSQMETKTRSFDDVRMSFPEDLEAKLDFEDKEDYITVKPKQFLGSDNFAKIAATIRGMGGEYISAGKDSHFRVPKKKPIN